MLTIIPQYTAPLPKRRGVAATVLVSELVPHHSPLVEAGPGAAAKEPSCFGLIAALLERTGFDVAVHRAPPRRRRTAAPETAARTGSEQWRLPLPSGHAARLRFIDTMPLAPTLLLEVDFLVTLPSAVLLQACRAGLKPVQIGQALIGSGAFSDFFRDPDAFIEALAKGSVGGRLALAEYCDFEQYCGILLDPAAAGPGSKSRTIAERTRCAAKRHDKLLDELVSDIRRARSLRPPISSMVRGTLSNPLAALRLLTSDRCRKSPYLRPPVEPKRRV